MRVSMLSGSLRVTTTSGFLRCAMMFDLRHFPPPGQGVRSVQVSLTAVLDTVLFEAGASLSNRWTCEDKGPGAIAAARADRNFICFHGVAMNPMRNSRIVWQAWLAALVLIVGLRVATVCAAGEVIGPKSGLPMPRFVSLKPDRVNVRGGPRRDPGVPFGYP